MPVHCAKRCRAAPIVLCSASKFATFGCPEQLDAQKWCTADMNILRTKKAAHLHSLVCKCASKLQRVKWRASSFPSLWFRSTYLPIDQKTTLHSICKGFAASNDLIDLVESTAPVHIVDHQLWPPGARCSWCKVSPAALGPASKP